MIEYQKNVKFAMIEQRNDYKTEIAIKSRKAKNLLNSKIRM